MRPAKRLRLRFSSLQLLLLLLLWAAPRPCAAGDEEDDDDAGLPGHKDHHWSYKDMPEWASVFPTCGGHMQSPININTAAVSFSVKLEPLLLSGYDLPPEETLPLKNNGHTGEETAVAGFDVAKLLPYDFDRYFRYNGSLTTPPCYQTVNWTVFNQTVRLSQEQISVLEETLQGDDDEPIQSNFRLLQDLYGRSILSSFHTLEKVHPPGGGPSEEGGDQAEPEAGGVLSSPLPDGTSRDGLDPTSGKDAEKRVGISLHTGDILAILFGSLFAATALAFLFFVHKHRRQASRAQATKPAALYTLASTDEHAL